MLTESGPQLRALDDIFIQATRPHTDLQDYLSFLTEEARRMTGSRVGFLALDPSRRPRAFYGSGEDGLQSYMVIKAAEQKPTPTLTSIREAIDLYTGAKNAARNRCMLTAVASPAGSAKAEGAVDLLLGSACTAWIQLSDGYSPMGWLGLGSDRPDAYPERLLESLHARLSQGMVVVNRLLLREYAKKNGREINLLGRSPKLLEFEREVKQAASHNRGPVLIRGERGSGKELAAYGVHYFSKRREGPFVSILTPALAESMQADELFGHERNSFTGAAAARKGKFLIAEGGTVFLDEVGSLSPTLQFTLLRVLEYGEIQPVGRDLPMTIDVRVVTATNVDPQRLVAEGRLRDDLFDRLNVIELQVPPLRERPEDIPLLIQHFLEKECEQVSRKARLAEKRLCQSCGSGPVAACASAEFYEAMQAYDWPGNVRELENLMTRLATMVRGEVLKVQHLPDYIIKNSETKARPASDDLSLNTLVKRHIENVLALTGRNESRAARLLGIPRSTLRSKIKKLGGGHRGR